MFQRLRSKLRSVNSVRRVLAFKKRHAIKRIVAPTRLIFEPSSACNYRCPKCLYPDMKRSRAFADPDRFSEFLRSWRYLWGPFRGIEFTGAGEVLLHQDFVKLVASASQFMPESTLVTTSNLALFDRPIGEALISAGLRSWQISLDSADESEYERLTGRTAPGLRRVIENIRLLWELLNSNPSPRNRLTVLAHRPFDADYECKVREIESLIDGICHAFNASPYQTLNGRKLGSEYSASDSLYQVSRYPIPCDYLWKDLVAVNDGTVRVCCSDMFDSPADFGNIFRDTPAQIVWNPNRRTYQEKMLRHELDGVYLCDKCHAPRA